MDLSGLFEFKNPTRILFGLNVMDKAAEVVASFGTKRVFLVTDPGVVRAGLVDRVAEVLKRGSVEYSVFDQVEANPRTTTVHRGAEVFKEGDFGALLALGGGSAIDAAKGMAVAATHEGDVRQYTRSGGKTIHDRLPPLIAIPTTAGTGSEVTWVSVLTDPENKIKTVVASPFVAPKVGLVDPTVTLGLPPAITAFTGMDALVHAVEAYGSVKATPWTDMLALKAIDLIQGSLRQAVGNGANLEARSRMMLGSTLAGMAFINSTVGLVHAAAHAIGGLLDVPHGLANAVMLPRVMHYSLIAVPGRYRDVAVAMGRKVEGLSEMEGGRKAIEAVRELAADVGIPPDLGRPAIDATTIDALADETMNQKGSYPFGPRVAPKEDIVRILRESFGVPV
jgi:alcohol dehydrogenase